MFSSLSRLWSGNKSGGQFLQQRGLNNLSTHSTVCDIEVENDQRTRSLRHLLKLFHSECAVLKIPSGEADNTPKILIAAYDAGMSMMQLNALYESQILRSSKWQASPAEVSSLDWEIYIECQEYQRAFLDYFEDEVVENAYNWREVLDRYLYSNNESLIFRAFAGYGAPTLRLASAIETNSWELAMEALALFAVCPPTEPQCPSTFSTANSYFSGTSSVIEVLDKARVEIGSSNHDFNRSRRCAKTMWNQLRLHDFTETYTELQLALLSLMPQGSCTSSFAWLVAVGHALWTIVPILPSCYITPALAQWWWYALNAYIDNGCPPVTLPPTSSAEADGKVIERLQEKIQDSPIEEQTLEIILCLQAIKAGHDHKLRPKEFIDVAGSLLAAL